MIKGPGGHAYFIASTNEKDPVAVQYSPGTKKHWRYYGKVATQYWKELGPAPGLQVLVNRRFTYWAGKSPIPGGISYENFELKAPFINGSKCIFGMTPLAPQQFIETI